MSLFGCVCAHFATVDCLCICDYVDLSFLFYIFFSAFAYAFIYSPVPHTFFLHYIRTCFKLCFLNTKYLLNTFFLFQHKFAKNADVINTIFDWRFNSVTLSAPFEYSLFAIFPNLTAQLAMNIFAYKHT